MTDEFKNLLEALSGAPLSEEEQASMRARLLVHMREHPARVPFRLRALDFVSSATAALARPQLQLAAGALALVFIAGGGTAYAAGGSLPGQPLYPVKVDIEEPIQGSFATSAQAQANWNEQLAARRLSEAEELAAQNKLTPATASTVTQGLDQATENFDSSISQLATSSSNTATVATLESNMEATLAANTQVLGEIANAVPDTAASIEPLISRTVSRTIALNNARTHYDMAAASDTVAVEAAAQAQLDAVQGELNTIRTNANAPQPQTLAAEASVQAGQQNLAQGNYEAALETSQAATLDEQEAQVNAGIAGVLQGAGVNLSAAAAISPASSSVNATSTTASSSPEATSTPRRYKGSRSSDGGP